MIPTLVTFLPLVGALIVLFMPKEEEGLHRGTAIATSLVTFFASLTMLSGFSPTGWNHEVNAEWVAGLGIRYHMGADGISLWLIILTTFLMPVIFLSIRHSIEKRVREFVICMLVLETGILGSFFALDLFFFYVFWEVMLVPMYLLIGIWGGEKRIYAAIKFFLYTIVGSLLMIVAILYLYVKHHDATGVWSFDYDALSRLVLSPTEQLFCFLAFASAFVIKVPLFPFHTWLPDAHTEAPTPGSVILAGVLLKLGTYGLLRFAIPFFPSAVAQCAPYLATLGVIGIIYASFVAFAQDDIKKLIAYSSVAHLGFVVLGLAVWNAKAIDGAVYQMLAHGISTGGLFLCVGVLYERRHTRKLEDYGGLASVMPRFTAVFMIMTMASVGLPGLSGFVGEFLILLGSFSSSKVWEGTAATVPYALPLTVAAATGVIFSAVYMLYLFQKVMFGPVTSNKNLKLPDLNFREVGYFLPMVLMAFWLGIYPSTFLRHIDPAVKKTVAFYQQKSAVKVANGAAPQMMSADAKAADPTKEAQKGTD